MEGRGRREVEGGMRREEGEHVIPKPLFVSLLNWNSQSLFQ